MSNKGDQFPFCVVGGEVLVKHPGADITRDTLNCAFEVHNALGPGFLESVYEHALSYELRLGGIRHERQLAVPVYYKNVLVGEHRLDLLVNKQVIVELKSVEEVTDIRLPGSPSPSS